MPRFWAVWNDDKGIPVLGTISFDERAAMIKGINYMHSDETITAFHSDKQVEELFHTMAEQRGNILHLVPIEIKEIKEPDVVVMKKRSAAK